MCNDYRLEVETSKIFEDFAELKIKIRFSEGAPNIEARQDIKITDTAPIVRTLDGERGAGDLVQRRWSWPGQNRKPVYNFRSDGREFNTGRCLIIADGDWFYFAGICQPATSDWPESYAILTVAANDDIAPYHDRQMAVLRRGQRLDWLDGLAAENELLRPLPPGSFSVRAAGSVTAPQGAFAF